MMMTTTNRARRLALGIAVAVVVGLTSWTQPADSADWKTPLIPISDDFKLSNGLRVVLSEDHSVPVVSLVLIYDVGARNEKKGRSGFAHLFEHMMFEGSENVGKTEHFKRINGAGGSTNAATHTDFTNYYDRLPSNQLELALWLESDRLRSLKINEENFKNQLETVKEEKRMRIDNQPYSPAFLKFGEMSFDNWANAHPTIGSFEDLEASSIEDVRNFFKTYYAPNNAVLAIVGDIDSKETKRLVEKYFGTIPSAPQPAKPEVAEPPRTTPKYDKVTDAHAQLPGFIMAWKAPPTRDPDYYPLVMLEKILSDGESSRLYQRMVKGDKVAMQVSAGLDGRRGPSSFTSFAIYKPGNTAEKVREIIWEELEKVQKTPVTQVELEKARNQILRDYFSSSSHESLQRSLGRANQLAEYALFWGDPKLGDEDMQKVMQVTAEDIQRVAQKLFTRNGVAVLDIEPAEAGKPPAKKG